MENYISKSRHLCMKELPCGERPYEKCVLGGAASLSDEELLAVLLRFGTGKKRVTEVARSVLSKCEEYGGLGCIDRIPDSELRELEGIGRVRTIQLKCIAELARRMSAGRRSAHGMRINSPRDVWHIFESELGCLEVEEVWALYLDGGGYVIKKSLLTRGTVNGSPISGRELYKEAVRCACAGVVLIHNHPSGDPEPSLDDIDITKTLYEGGRLMDIDLLDHVIIGGHRFFSMRERGILK